MVDVRQDSSNTIRTINTRSSSQYFMVIYIKLVTIFLPLYFYRIGRYAYVKGMKSEILGKTFCKMEGLMLLLKLSHSYDHSFLPSEGFLGWTFWVKMSNSLYAYCKIFHGCILAWLLYFLQVLNDCLGFAGPLLLNRLIRFLQQGIQFLSTVFVSFFVELH